MIFLSTSRSEEHTSELQSHSEISYAVFCLKKKKKHVLATIATGFARDRPALMAFFDQTLYATQTADFFFNDTATTEIYTLSSTLSLHDALPISTRRRHTRILNVTGVQTCALPIDRKSTRLKSSHIQKSRMPSSA